MNHRKETRRTLIAILILMLVMFVLMLRVPEGHSLPARAEVKRRAEIMAGEERAQTWTTAKKTATHGNSSENQKTALNSIAAESAGKRMSNDGH